MNKQEIGHTIKNRRKDLKIDQVTLALLSEVGINTLISTERGQGNPSIDKLLKILDTLGLQFNITLKDDYEKV